MRPILAAISPPGVCTFGESSDCPADTATIFWRCDANPAVLAAEACRPAERRDAFDLRGLSQTVTILRLGNGIEQVLVGSGERHIQLEVRGRSLLDGPVELRYDLHGFDQIEAKLLTVRRLVALRRLGHFPRSLFPPERRAPRWRIALQALDASWAGLPSREIAVALFGDRIAQRDWDGASDYLRSRVRRAIALGETLAAGGYLGLLR
jgi:hypothetical protein